MASQPLPLLITTINSYKLHSRNRMKFIGVRSVQLCGGAPSSPEPLCSLDLEEANFQNFQKFSWRNFVIFHFQIIMENE